MGYFLTSKPENAVPGKSRAMPKTHTPGSRLEKRGLGFDFNKTGGAATTMRAVADKCRNEGGAEGRQMDGDRVTPGGDNREWSF